MDFTLRSSRRFASTIKARSLKLSPLVVTYSVAQIFFKTKLAVIRMVTMCWKPPYLPSLGTLFFLACISASWHPDFMGHVGRLSTLETTHPGVSSSRHIFPKNETCLTYFRWPLCGTFNIHCFSQALGWRENTRVRGIAITDVPNHILVSCWPAVWLWLHD